MKRALTVLMLALIVTAMMAVTASLAFAKIEEQRTNPAGKPTQGQGEAITVQNVNPSGKAPPGQNK